MEEGKKVDNRTKEKEQSSLQKEVENTETEKDGNNCQQNQARKYSDRSFEC